MTGFVWPLPSADVVGDLPGGAVLRLRAPVDTDLEGLVVSGRDAGSRRFTGFPENYTRRDAALFLRTMMHDPGAMLWIVDDPDRQGGFGGTVELRLVELNSATVELGYTTAPHLRGRGLMTASVRLICEYLFDYGVHRVQIRANPENLASCKVARNAGFRLEGTLRDAECLRGQWNDLCIFSRLEGEV
ncbi:GNAT family N-acetyltransferase [Corynebacterium neomassiliense]|uniref:GNAT family N-acetyltransferase n=1 Tax=Corynebacterium neomassiliense TaxID=2079482 RepID=UPI001030C41A|nr:GNAT family protein [Corynebacterium neomassiliense]